ncbi:TadE/TadG family type IV pilus assembly protein [Aggregatibacter aphrophilus]|uniref:TadE/TadG family type IV pilus assembly protein n=1 Tax=Aggregatibacter aphrophilus TaxID=732 RepID=UPI000DA3FB19|nr:TadE/TadG family type IV pilus assembly protein [Aggregatibacter aphrophilus]SQI99814.1 Flp pilus assembly protein TadG [Aggregatibacter aphrophilus]
MKKFNMTMNLFYMLKRFYHDKKGVYAVMTALLAFPLLFLIAFAVDGSGILLDRARLAQATEQAALLLTTENNQYRADKSNLSNVQVTDEEIKNAKGSFRTAQEQKENAQALKRNQELVQGMVKLYLRSYDKEQKNSSPITIPKNFYC